MTKRTMRIVISVCSGLLAGLFGLVGIHNAQLGAQEQIDAMEQEFGGERIDVCVAVRDIAAGSKITVDDIDIKQMLKSYVPVHACKNADDLIGKLATSNVPQGAVLTEVYVQQNTDSLDVPTGYVAVSIPSTDQFAVGGALMRGDFVDVYVSSDGLTQQLITRAYVIDTSVLSTKSNAHLDWVTIAVEPQKVNEVLTASSEGTIFLTLPGDTLPSEATDENSASEDMDATEKDEHD